MSLAVLRTMLIALVRDRGALAVSFLLPVAFFLVFALIFQGATGDTVRVRIAVSDEGQTEATGRLVRALSHESALQFVDADGKAAGDPLPLLTSDEVRALVHDGRADVGLIVRAGAGDPAAALGGGGDAEEGDLAPMTLVEDSARAIAGRIVMGLVQKAYVGALPDLTAQAGISMFEAEVGGLTPEQKQKWDRSMAALKADALEAEKEGDTGSDIEEMVEVEQVTGRSAGQNQVAYYAGAVAVMFVLFAAANAAVVLIEERDAGIVDRILAGPAGMAPLVNGKFLFLVLSGFVQVTVIFVVAWLLRGVDLPGNFLAYSIVTLATSAAAAGLALALTTACRNRRQANHVATIGILILSAIGGSMVPRMYMPPLFQTLGWLTPNTWALEAYSDIFWRDEPLSSIVLPVTLLLLVAVAGYVITRQLTRRWERI